MPSENPTEYAVEYGYGYRLSDGTMLVGRSDMGEEMTRAFVEQQVARIKRTLGTEIPPEVIVRQVVKHPWTFEDED